MNKNHFSSRRSVLKTLGVAAVGAPFITRGLMARSPDGVLRHAGFGAAGKGWDDLTQIAKCPSVMWI